MTQNAGHDTEDFDWALTTFAGARREQLRRWAQLPLADIVRALEEMEQDAATLRGSRRAGPDAAEGES
jgi:hypothetical protein